MLRDFWQVFAQTLRESFRLFGSSVEIVFGGTIGTFASIIVGVRPPARPDTYEARMSSISTRLAGTTKEAQALFDELEASMAARKAAVDEAERRMAQLVQRETQTAERIRALESSSPAAAAAFHQLMEASLTEDSRRSNRRDLVIFGLGILASIIVQVVYGIAVGDIKLH